MPIGGLAATLAEGVTAMQGQHYADALRIFTPLANSGDDEAQRLLGEMIFNGQGVPQNPEAAASWTRLAAENGNRIAQYNLGYLHERGAGVPQSVDSAMVWYTRSAQQQYVLAQRRLGELHAPKDIRQAHYWFDQARRNGDEVAFGRYLALGREIEEIEAPRREAERKALQAEKEAKAAEERREERAERRAHEARQANRPSLTQAMEEALAQSRSSNARIASMHNQMVGSMLPPTRQPAPRPSTPPNSRPGPSASDGMGAGHEKPAGATRPAAASKPQHHWPYRFEFQSSAFNAETEHMARSQVARVRARQEDVNFAKGMAQYQKTGVGYVSWRIRRSEPMVCQDASAKDGSRSFWQCRQRVDYDVVSTETPMGEGVYPMGYSAAVDGP